MTSVCRCLCLYLTVTLRTRQWVLVRMYWVYEHGGKKTACNFRAEQLYQLISLKLGTNRSLPLVKLLSTPTFYFSCKIEADLFFFVGCLFPTRDVDDCVKETVSMHSFLSNNSFVHFLSDACLKISESYVLCASEWKGEQSRYAFKMSHELHWKIVNVLGSFKYVNPLNVH